MWLLVCQTWEWTHDGCSFSASTLLSSLQHYSPPRCSHSPHLCRKWKQKPANCYQMLVIPRPFQEMLVFSKEPHSRTGSRAEFHTEYRLSNESISCFVQRPVGVLGASGKLRLDLLDQHQPQGSGRSFEFVLLWKYIIPASARAHADSCKCGFVRDPGYPPTSLWLVLALVQLWKFKYPLFKGNF